ncbi:MAG: DnaA/Hda family protein [Clostridium sp.]|nr:MAG: DnaA/Hda family protein [Clostridium sp.]
MHAIGNYIVQKSNKKVLYVTSEEFISDFIGINKKDENNYDIVSQFKEKYRNIDILMIDDIQFLGGAAKNSARILPYIYKSL